MKGFKNPAAFLREKLCGKIKGAGKSTIWIFFLIEIIAIIAAFAINKDRYTYFCQIFGCSPIGGIYNMSVGIGMEVIKGNSFKAIMASWLTDYGQWLLGSFQYLGLMVLLHCAKESGINPFFQFFHGIVNLLFSGIILLLLSEYALFEEKGLVMFLVNSHNSHPELTWKNVWLWLYILMVIILVILIALTIFSVADVVVSFLIRSAIFGGIAGVLLLVRAIIGSRVNSGGATETEQEIVQITNGIFTMENLIGWVIAIVLIMGYILAAVNMINPKKPKAPKAPKAN